MIKSKNDLVYYLEQDRKALGKTYKKPKLIGDDIWKLQILLRKCEYLRNCKKNYFSKVLLSFYKLKCRNKRIKLGIQIPFNVFGPGLSIAHFGTIVVNDRCKIGKNCRIHEGVTIGATNGQNKAPTIGDNVFIGTGAKIIGDIYISDNIAIGANSVVVHSFLESNITIAGNPAKKINNNNSYSNLNKDIVNELKA